MPSPLVINLFAGPGAGKSTLRAEIFARMKRMGLKVEEVTEFAKDLTWDKNTTALADQLYILGNQNRRLHRLRDQVDFIVSDSPLLLGINYVTPDYLPGSFQKLVWELWNSYRNINYFIQRTKKYSPVGRSQTEEGAKKIDGEILNLLEGNKVGFSTVVDSNKASEVIVNVLKINGWFET